MTSRANSPMCRVHAWDDDKVGVKKQWLRSCSFVALVLVVPAMLHTPAARAETMSGALTKSYGYSPDLNQQRAATRAADEGVPRATAGWRPTLTASSSVGSSINRQVDQGKLKQDTNTVPRVNSVAMTQTLYNRRSCSRARLCVFQSKPRC